MSDEIIVHNYTKNFELEGIHKTDDEYTLRTTACAVTYQKQNECSVDKWNSVTIRNPSVR